MGKAYGLPQRLFEAGDVVLRDRNFKVGARNERRLCALICTSQDNAFEEIHGVLDRIMQLNQYTFNDSDKPLKKMEYTLGKSNKRNTRGETFLKKLHVVVSVKM